MNCESGCGGELYPAEAEEKEVGNGTTMRGHAGSSAAEAGEEGEEAR